MATLKKSIIKRNALLEATLHLTNTGGIQEASMAKVAKMAGVSPATIYIYFENKEDMIHKLYLDIKTSFAQKAFENYNPELPVKESFESIWLNMCKYKISNKEKASFLSQCDNTPLINEKYRDKGIKSLQPLFDLWERGQKEGIIKNISPYLLYAFSIYPMAFLINMHNRSFYEVNNEVLKNAFQTAWDSISTENNNQNKN